MKIDIRALKTEYRRLCRRLAHTGWISHGYVQDRGPGAGGPCYQWTRKERKKTVSVALSKEQYLGLKRAIANWQNLQKTLRRMEQVSRRFLFLSLPDARRRKPLSKKVMGLI
jgi:hypothetical protein